MPWDLSGRTVLITGAARGIGAETARQLRQRGARLSLVGLEPELLEQRAAELGGDTAFFEADVVDLDALERAAGETVERFGGIDVVVANAGVAGGGPVAAMDPDAFTRVIEVNLLGVYRTVRAALPHVTARSGYVLPIASLAAALHGPMMAAYSASKAGVEALADSLRTEGLRPTGNRGGLRLLQLHRHRHGPARHGPPVGAAGEGALAARPTQAASGVGRRRSGRARHRAARALRLRAALGAARALPAHAAAAAQRARDQGRGARGDAAPRHGGADGAHDAATSLAAPGAAPARSAAATSGSVPAWIAARRSAMSRARKARLCSVTSRMAVSSRLFIR